MKPINEIWVDFACAAIAASNGVNLDVAANIADEMLSEYDKRYGQAAVILAGIYHCRKCQEKIVGKFISTDGSDGEYKKFCMACVNKVQDEMSNPGIAVATSTPNKIP